MDEAALFDLRMRESVATIRRAFAGLSADHARPPGDMPSGEETRELLGLFARLPSEGLRKAVLGLMRTIVETGIETR